MVIFCLSPSQSLCFSTQLSWLSRERCPRPKEGPCPVGKPRLPITDANHTLHNRTRRTSRRSHPVTSRQWRRWFPPASATSISLYTNITSTLHPPYPCLFPCFPPCGGCRGAVFTHENAKTCIPSQRSSDPPSSPLSPLPYYYNYYYF